jgi:hypothetical protein
MRTEWGAASHSARDASGVRVVANVAATREAAASELIFTIGAMMSVSPRIFTAALMKISSNRRLRDRVRPLVALSNFRSCLRFQNVAMRQTPDAL